MYMMGILERLCFLGKYWRRKTRETTHYSRKDNNKERRNIANSSKASWLKFPIYDWKELKSSKQSIIPSLSSNYLCFFPWMSNSNMVNKVSDPLETALFFYSHFFLFLCFSSINFWQKIGFELLNAMICPFGLVALLKERSLWNSQHGCLLHFGLCKI